jgi:hypothetical protein
MNGAATRGEEGEQGEAGARATAAHRPSLLLSEGRLAAGQLQEQLLQLVFVLRGLHRVLARLEGADLLFDRAALAAQLRDPGLGGGAGGSVGGRLAAAQEGPARQGAVAGGGIGRGAARAVAVVVQQGVFGGEEVALLVEALDLAPRVGEGLEHGHALVLVRVRALLAEGLDEVARELRLVALHRALGGGDDRAALGAEDLHEVAARAGRVHEHDLLPAEGGEERARSRPRSCPGRAG